VHLTYDEVSSNDRENVLTGQFDGAYTSTLSVVTRGLHIVQACSSLTLTHHLSDNQDYASAFHFLPKLGIQRSSIILSVKDASVYDLSREV
jgi:hypothetical protein